MITGINFYGYHLQIVSIMATLQRKKEYAISKSTPTISLHTNVEQHLTNSSGSIYDQPQPHKHRDESPI